MTTLRNLLIVIFVWFVCSASYAQNDTTSGRSYWSPNTLGLRTSVGYAKTPFIELGISYHKAGGDIVAPVGMGIYSSIEYIPSILPIKPNNIFGIKIGTELAGHLTVGAVEFKYITDFIGREDIIFTPKVGLGIWTMIGVMYGYNISMGKISINEIGLHQFSVVVNIDKLLLKGF